MKWFQHKWFAGKSETALVYLDQGLVSGMNFLSGIVIARLLGLHGFGVFSIAWMGVLISSSVHQSLVIVPMQTLCAKKNQEEFKKYFQGLMLQHLLLSLGAGIIAFLAIAFMTWMLDGWNVRSIILSFPLAVTGFLMQDFLRKYFLLMRKNKLALILDTIAYAGLLLSAISINFIRSLDASTVLLLVSLFFLYASLVGLFYLPTFSFNLKQLKETVIENWQFSRWMAATSVLQFFAGNFFIIAAGALLGPVAVGATKMAQNIVGITHVIFLAMENTVPSKAANFQRVAGDERMMKYLVNFSAKMGAATVFILLLIAIFSQSLIRIFYGGEFVSYDYMLKGFCVLYVIVFIGYPMRYAIRTLENTHHIFYAFVISSAFSISAAYPMIRMFGLAGVLAGLFITQLIALAYYSYSLRKQFVHLQASPA